MDRAPTGGPSPNFKHPAAFALHTLKSFRANQGLLLATMLFFSSLAFTVLENAFSAIFHHRVALRRRRFLISAVMPYGFILCLGLGLLLATLVAGSLQTLGQEDVDLLGRNWSLVGVSGVLLYLLGFAGEVFVLTAVYLVMPVGRPSLQHALVGAVTVALLSLELAATLLLLGAQVISEYERIGKSDGADAPPQPFTTEPR